MTDPISGARPPGLDNAAARRAQDAPAKGADEAGKSRAIPAPDDELKLSDAAQRAMTAPDVDRAKVDAIKQALAEGRYPIDPKRIAESFMALEKMIGKSGDGS
jgi:negative regulator of flagellin synthesis FlgM